MNVLTPIQGATMGNLYAWSGIVGVDWDGLRNLAKWGWSVCDKGGTVPNSGELDLGMDW